MIAFKTEMMAECLGLTKRRVRQLKSEGILREIKPGLYEPTENIRAYIEYVKKGSGESDADYYAERAGLVAAKRKKEELELKVLEGELHSAEDIEIVITAMLTRFKSRMRAIPSKASAVISQNTSREKVYEIIKKYIDEALEELSDYDKIFGQEQSENDGKENRAADTENS